ncbi:hypothetical protein M406DRAFT_69696 [Cryphonectria parasitica EP155]|uniref:Uncharacterized protein n=1 Tax=Cryphonectria parasitica (strain ATCC 38755 / EP155) TaxID=660469 RepID=A0A9P4Y6U5_CRYP1|nr:uncharacterized protein M406DRAFT_69696 [Cryphonectria parasitica EP155]KAF3767560.1 hypothetical protein M406DRAFT_69696 [Cryphonectria parasitica EP155]
MFDNITFSSRRTLLLLAVAAPAASVLLIRAYIMRDTSSYTSGRLSKRTTAQKTDRAISAPVSTLDLTPPLPQSFPSSVAANDFADHIVWHERVVSKPVLLSALVGREWDEQEVDEILTRYVRGTMCAFAKTPQSGLLWKMVPADVRLTFEKGYIDTMDFRQVGQRVDGVYTVQHRGAGPEGIHGQRVELRLDAPEGYTGPKSDGMIVASVEAAGGDATGLVVFANETWLWRRRDGEKPTLLESAVGRWLHSLMAAWLIREGVSALQVNSVPVK